MRRSQRKLNLDMLVQAKVIEPESKAWLTEALDPFHDTPIKTTGMPDTNLSASIVQEVKYTQALKQPASIGGTNNWDTNIVLWPIPRQYTPSASNLCSNVGPTTGFAYDGLLRKGVSGANLFPVGGATAYSVISGNQTYGDTAGTTSTTDVTIGLEQVYLEGNCRIVGMGIEVANTTAPLYRQGQVYGYRQPTPPPGDRAAFVVIETSATMRREEISESVLTQDKRRRSCEMPSCPCAHAKDDIDLPKKGDGSDPDPLAVAYINRMGWCDIWQCPSPPRTVAAALKLAGTTCWEAEYGGYAVATMNQTNNPAQTQKPVAASIALQDTGTSGVATTQLAIPFSSTNDTDWLGPLKAGAAGSVAPQMAGPLHIAPYNFTGLYFTGLSPQTTLQITIKYFVERFPTPYENNLIVLARPSSPFDPAALNLYGMAMNGLPVAVPVGENPLGEWWGDVLDKVAGVVSPVAKGLAMIPGIGAPAAIAGNVADAYLAARGKPGPSPLKKADKAAKADKKAKKAKAGKGS